jgi:hypothetical protein
MSTPYVFLVEYTLNDPIYIILEIEIFRNNCVSNSPYVSEQISVHYVSLSTLLYVLQAWCTQIEVTLQNAPRPGPF